MKKLRYTLLTAVVALLFTSCDKVSPTGILIAETAVEDRVKMSYEYYFKYKDEVKSLVADQQEEYTFLVGADSHLTTDEGRLREMLQNALDHDDLLITHLGDIADTKAEYYIRLEEILTDYKRMYAEKKYKTVFVGDEDDDYQVLSDDYYIYIDTITNKPYTLNDVKYPFYPVVGNHDITRSGWALWSSIFHTSFYSIYVTVNTDPMTVDKFIFLDTANGTLGREQVSLIEQGVLDAKKQEEVGLYVRNTFVFSHTNIFHVSSMELASSFAREETYFLLNQFKEWKVNIAFFGHVHEWDERRNGKTEYLTLETMCEANNPSPGDYLVRVHVRKDGTIRWERVRMNYTPSE
jgi:predicted phosphodiesterase